MKKLISIFIILCVCLSVSACGGNGGGQTSSTSTTTAQETTTEAMPDANPSGTYGGNEILAARVSDIVPEGLSFDGANLRSSDFAVYKNKYPVGQEGALYEVTAEIGNRIIDNFVRFAGLLGYKLDSKKYTTSGKIYFHDEETGISSGIETVSSRTTLNEVSANTTPEELKELIKTNSVLKAACEFSGISDKLEIVKTINYKTDGTVGETEFSVFEKRDSVSSPAEEKQFKYLKIIHYTELKESLVFASLKIREKAEIEFTPVSFADAVSECAKRYAQGTGKEADKDRMTTCEVEYSAKIYRDYYVPCYVFTLEVDNPVKDSKLKAFEQYYIPMFTSAEAEIFSAG